MYVRTWDGWDHVTSGTNTTSRLRVRIPVTGGEAWLPGGDGPRVAQANTNAGWKPAIYFGNQFGSPAPFNPWATPPFDPTGPIAPWPVLRGRPTGPAEEPRPELMAMDSFWTFVDTPLTSYGTQTGWGQLTDSGDPTTYVDYGYWSSIGVVDISPVLYTPLGGSTLGGLTLTLVSVSYEFTVGIGESSRTYITSDFWDSFDLGFSLYRIPAASMPLLMMPADYAEDATNAPWWMEAQGQYMTGLDFPTGEHRPPDVAEWTTYGDQELIASWSINDPDNFGIVQTFTAAELAAVNYLAGYGLATTPSITGGRIPKPSVAQVETVGHDGGSEWFGVSTCTLSVIEAEYEIPVA